MDNYDDIINLERPISKRHGKMPIGDRAAQFAPFAALTGFGDVIKETARLTDKKIELDEEEKELLNQNLHFLKSTLNSMPRVTITYFEKDLLKEGGKYINLTGNLKKIDEYKKKIIMIDGTEIKIDNIIEIKFCNDKNFMIE